MSSARERRQELKEIRTSGKSDTSGKRSPSGRRDRRRHRRRRAREERRRERETTTERLERLQREEKQDVNVPVHPDEERVIDPMAEQPTIEVEEPVDIVSDLINGPAEVAAIEEVDASIPIDQADDIYEEEEVYEHPVKEDAPLQTEIVSAVESHVESSTWEVGRPTSMGGQPRAGSIGRRLKDPVQEKIEGFEEWSFGLAKGIREEGYKAGALAREAEGPVEALGLGLVATGLRFSAGVVEEATFLARPRQWVRTVKGIYEAAKAAKEDPVGSTTGLATAVAHDPGMVVEIGASFLTGYTMAKGVQALSPGVPQVSRLDDLDIDVVRTAHEIVEDPRPLGAIKTLEGPEVTFKGTVTSRRVPKIVGEIMEEELKDVGVTTTILGVEEARGVTGLTKVDIPTSAIDDLLKGRGSRFERFKRRLTGKGAKTTTTTVDDVLDVEVLRMGQESGFGVDVVKTPMADDLLASRRRGLLASRGKELGQPSIIDDVKFGGPWFDEGREGILRGRHRFDVKGAVSEVAEEIVEDVDNITFVPKDPDFKKTPWKTSFPDEVTKVDDVRPPRRPRPPAPEVKIVDEIVEGMKPVAKATTKIEPAVGVPGLSSVATIRDARERRMRGKGPPKEFEAERGPPSAYSTPDVRGKPGWEKTSPFYVPHPDDVVDKEKETKAETIQRRRKDRRRRREDAPQPPTLVDLLEDKEDVIPKTEPKTKDRLKDKLKDKPDQIPDQVPDQVPDVITVPDVVQVPDVKPVEIVDVVPVEIVEPVVVPSVVPITIATQKQRQRQRQRFPWPAVQQPVRPRIFREPRARRKQRPLIDFGKINIYRTLRIGTPKQQLRGTFGRGIPGFGLPLKREQPTRKKKRKKRKGEEEGLLGMLFGG